MGSLNKGGNIFIFNILWQYFVSLTNILFFGFQKTISVIKNLKTELKNNFSLVKLKIFDQFFLFKIQLYTYQL